MKLGSKYCMNFWKSLPSIYCLTTSFRGLEELSSWCGASQALLPLQHLHHGGSSTEGFPQFSALFICFRKFTLCKSKLLTKASSSSLENMLYRNVKCAGHGYQSKSIHLLTAFVDFWLFWTCCETLTSVLDACIKSERRQRVTGIPL